MSYDVYWVKNRAEKIADFEHPTFRVQYQINYIYLHPKGYNYISMSTSIAAFVKERRHMFGLTQVDLAEKSGVGLRFLRELEQGKQTLRIDKINQVLALFGHEVGAQPTNNKEEQ